MAGPFKGIRVLDMSTVLMGPYASQMMADMGADVIKIEPPQGDVMRKVGPMRHDGMGALFLHVNRGKRSIVLDLKVPAGLDVLRRMLVDADVLLYNLRPHSMERLGLGYEAVARINPRLIYLGTFGFGEAGRYAGRPAFDDLIQGAIGLPSLMHAAGTDVPRYVPANIADRTVGLHAVAVLGGALYHREKTGRGQRIDIPMFETMVNHLLGDHLAGQSFDPPLGPAGYPRLLASNRRPYRTRDSYVCAMIYNDPQWIRFLSAIGRSELWGTDPRLADMNTRTQHAEALQTMLGEIFLERTTQAWLALLEQADIPCMPLHTVDTLLQDPHLADVGLFEWTEHPTEGRLRQIGVPTRWSDSQPEPGTPAPRAGEHSLEILQELGCTAVEIEELMRSGAAAGVPGADRSTANPQTLDTPQTRCAPPTPSRTD
ncbi:CaiB/BaiF CoA transferase family protein [Castellaniella sp.]|uniref:CaiB/BaiF CoA transferase family protein n=1 Tax=Castellaniella sp. TaxID=1955812 RepID=UPI00355FB3E2